MKPLLFVAAKPLSKMEIESQMAAHKAATEILKAAEKQDSKFHFILLTTHDDGNVSACSRHASLSSQTQMLASSLGAKDLAAALSLAIEK